MCVPGFIYLLLRDVTDKGAGLDPWDKGYSISLDLPWGHVLKSHLHIDDLCLKSWFFFWGGRVGVEDEESKCRK